MHLEKSITVKGKVFGAGQVRQQLSLTSWKCEFNILSGLKLLSGVKKNSLQAIWKTPCKMNSSSPPCLMTRTSLDCPDLKSVFWIESWSPKYLAVIEGAVRHSQIASDGSGDKVDPIACSSS